MGLAAFLFFLAFIAAALFAGYLYKKNEELSERNEQLRQYEPLKNLDAEIAKKEKQIIRANQVAAEKLTLELNDMRRQFTVEEAGHQSKLKNINAEIETLTQESRQALTEARAEKKVILDEATQNASTIIDNANDQAKHVGQEALDAQKNYRMYANGLDAMKRKVRGYGDEWLIPSHSVLDELAEEYSFKEAGRQLKAARERTRQLATLGRVADCDYADNIRRTTAMAFVTDAFNGSVDSILSDIRHDNYGKMKKKIEDAYNLVNLNGSAFRAARILPEYLTARLDELDWGTRVLVLQAEEREEQRQIRAQMREEEKARREFEKVQKEALKEEKMLEQAMAAARKELDGAHAGERDKYVQQLAELEQKWNEAEKKNQRALSMAQQTKRGHVYVISNIGSFGENVYKIGMTRRLEPAERVKELGDASVPFHFDVHSFIYSEDAPALETRLHQEFRDDQVNKVNSRKEFFRLNIAQIKQAVADLGVKAKWTLAAEAIQYRESMAMDGGMPGVVVGA